MNNNLHKISEDPVDQPVKPDASLYGTGKVTRIVFYSQFIGLILCSIAGMSETYPALAWGQWLTPFALLAPVSLFFPLVIHAFGQKENVSPGRLFIAVSLSAMMALASSFAIYPLL